MPDTCGIIVTFNPPPGLGRRVQALARQCDALILVDNGSRTTPRAEDFAPEDRVEIIINSDNLGIAHALNQGVARAAELGARYALLLDHDSVLAEGARAQLESCLRAHPNSAACVPRILYSLPDIRCRWPQTPPGWRWRFRFLYADEQTRPQPVDLAISSGMLVDITHFRTLGGFDDSLFIDLVDTEFCLRARRRGLGIIAVPGASLQHELGNPSRHKLPGGLTAFPTHHSAFRHYQLSRNRIILSRRYGWRFPSWLAYEWLGAAKLIFKVMLFESGRPGKLWAMLRGTAAGIGRAWNDRGLAE